MDAAPTVEVGPPPVPGFRHRSVMVRGARVHLAEVGPAGAPAVVLLHGFPQHWYAWREVAPMLAVDRHVIALDLPGSGWSEPSARGYSTTERARLVIDLLDELALREVDLVGHDWGAWLAYRVALDAPERVRRLVSISELHPWPVQRHLLPNLWRMWVTALFEMPGLGPALQRRRSLVRWFLVRDAARPAIWTDELVDRYAGPAGRPASARAGQRLHAAFVRHDIARLVLRRDRHRRFEIPTLQVTGDRDAYIPPAVLAVPSGRETVSRVRVVEGGHFILDENPGAVGALIGSHLAGGGPPGS